MTLVFYPITDTLPECWLAECCFTSTETMDLYIHRSMTETAGLLGSCVKVEVAVLAGLPSLISLLLMMS